MTYTNFNEKSNFIVALFVAFITLSFYSEFFTNIKLLFGSHEYPVIFIFNGMLVLLFICIYFYALDYTRKGSLDEWVIFRYFKSIGNFFYVFSLSLFPLALIAHILSCGIFLLISWHKGY